ncbi:hypothetical protein GW17_00033689, partial [Ensete ventricosum]
TTLHAVDVGSCPYDKRCCPRAAPRGRCRLVRALPLQEWPPLQAAALVVGLPLMASQRVATPCGQAVGASHARERPRMLAAALASSFGRGRPPPCRGAWLQQIAPCSRPDRGWPALHGGWPPLLLAAFAAKTQ